MMERQDRYATKYQEINYNASSPLEKAQYIYGMYLSGHSAITPEFPFIGNNYQNVLGVQKRSFRECRQYALSMQNVEKYKDQLDPKRRNGKRRWNISWDVNPTYTRIRSQIIDKFLDIQLYGHPYTTDIKGVTERKNLINKIRLMLKKEFAMMDTSGIRAEVEQAKEGLENESDLEFILQTNAIRSSVEMMMKDALDISEDVSSLDEIIPMLIADEIDYGCMGIHHYLDDNLIKHEYVDMNCFISRPSAYSDLRDTDFMAMIKNRKVHEIRRFFDEKDMSALIQQANKYNLESGFESYSKMGTEDFTLRELTVYYRDVDTEYYISGFHPKFNNKVFDKTTPDAKLSGRDKDYKEIINISTQYIYQFKWIVGTDFIYDHKKAEIIGRSGKEGNKTALFPFTIEIGKEPSLTERVISDIDDLQLARFKIRSMLASIPPAPRIIFFQDMLQESVRIGDESFTVLDMIKEFKSEGHMVLKRREYADYDEESQKRREPFHIVENSGIEKDYQLFKAEIMTAIDNIRNGVGLNDVADGTNTDPQLLKGVMDGMIGAANSALRPFIYSYINFRKRMSKKTMALYQALLAFGDIKVENFPGDSFLYRDRTITKELMEYSWDLTVSWETKESRQILLQAIMQRAQEMPSDVYMAVFNAYRDGDTKKAEYLLSKWEKKRQKMAIEQQKAMIEANAQAQIQANQAAEAERQKSEQYKTEGRKDFEAFKNQNREIYDQMKAQRESNQKIQEGAINKTVLEENQKNI